MWVAIFLFIVGLFVPEYAAVLVLLFILWLIYEGKYKLFK